MQQIFHILRRPCDRSYQHSGVDDASPEELTSYAQGTALPQTPVRLTWDKGRKKPADTVWISIAEFAVSPKFCGILSDFSGWSVFPVEVYDGWGQLVPGYSGLAITGRCGQVHNDLSRVEKQADWDWFNYVGLHFDLESWDGSDIFYPSQGPGPIVSDPLAKALRRAKLTNVLIEPLSEVRMEKGMVDRWLEQRRELDLIPIVSPNTDM